MSITVISLGESDSMSNELTRIGLKGPHSLFEGVVSGEFKDVVAVLKLVADGQDIPITKRDDFPGNSFLADTHIHTCLYEDVDFAAIVKERAAQLKADLTNGTPVVFVREDSPDTITKEDIDTFVGLVKKIAPESVSKLVVFSRSDCHVESKTEFSIHTKFNPVTNKEIILGCFTVAKGCCGSCNGSCSGSCGCSCCPVAVAEAAAPVEAAAAPAEEAAAPATE